jgi:hypothetical protein
MRFVVTPESVSRSMSVQVVDVDSGVQVLEA